MQESPVAAEGRDWRRIAFYAAVVISILVFGLLFGGVLALAAPLTSPGEGPGYEFPESHRWHDTQWGAFIGVLIVGSLVSLLWKPERKPAIAQFLVLTISLFIVINLIIGHFDSLIFAIPIGIVTALYPARERLFALESDRSWNLVLLIMTAVIVVILAPEAWDKLRIQLDELPGDEHAEFGHWAGSAMLLIGYLAAGLLAATRRPGYRYLGMLAGISLLYLGAGALIMPDGQGIVGTWDTTAALLSIVAGAAFITITLAGSRLGTPETARSRPATAGD